MPFMEHLYKNFIWTFVSQDIAILPRCPVWGWILKEARILTWRDRISQNRENQRLKFEHNVNQYFIFILWKFWLLILLQSWDIANVPKLISFSILGFFPAHGQTRVWLSQSYTQPKISNQVSKILFWWEEKSYAEITQKFLFCKKP